MLEIEISKKTLDIEAIVRSKSEKLYKHLPKFAFRYLKKILHEDSINEYLYQNKDRYGIDFASSIIENFGCSIKVIGEENIPKTGAVTAFANHPLGGLDGIALISQFGKIRKDIAFPVNDMLLALPNLREVFIPINKINSNSANQSKLKDAFAKDNLLLYFPSGLVSRRHKGGEIKDLEWKKTFISRSRENQRLLLPVFVAGKNSNFFYNFALLRKKLGFRFNIEQIYLVDEMFRQKGKEIKLVIGKPIDIEVLDSSRSDKDWAKALYKHVYSLGKEPNAIFSK